MAVTIVVQAMGQLTPADPRGIALLLAMLQGGIAAIIALKQGAPRWWLAIHLTFAPALLLVLRLDIAPGWFLAAFILLAVLFWRTDQSRVPLYLSNRPTATAVTTLMPATPCRLLDVGCGDGGLIRRLALARPDCRFVGIEHAPLPWLLAKLRTLRLPNAHVRYGDFWRESFSDYDVVYAFLSPAPMPRLWVKVCLEMRPGALLVSNSFAIPNVEAARIVEVADRRATQLYLYHPDKAGDSAAFPAIPPDVDRE